MKTKTVRNSTFDQYDSKDPRFAPLLDPDSSPKKGEKCSNNPKKEKMKKKKQSEIRLFTSTIQMSQESSRTDPYSPIFGHIKVLHFLTFFMV